MGWSGCGGWDGVVVVGWWEVGWGGSSQVVGVMAVLEGFVHCYDESKDDR